MIYVYIFILPSVNQKTIFEIDAFVFQTNTAI